MPPMRIVSGYHEALRLKLPGMPWHLLGLGGEWYTSIEHVFRELLRVGTPPGRTPSGETLSGRVLS